MKELIEGMIARMSVPFFIATVLILIFFIFQFIKQRKVYQIVLSVWIPVIWVANMIYDKNKTVDYILGGVQVLLFCVVIFSMFLKNKKQIAKTTASFNQAANEDENNKDETNGFSDANENGAEMPGDE